jgi:hypothetical protein
MIVFIINGAPRSGKDTFIELLREVTGKEVRAYSSIDWVKSKAYSLDWDGIKDTRGRKFLSDIKDACTLYDNTPFKKIIENIEWVQGLTYHVPYFATNIREPSEIQKLEDYCAEQGISCYSIWVRNLAAEEAASELNNSGDSQYMNHAYSYQIHNQLTTRSFKNNVSALMNIINKKEGEHEKLAS